MKWINNQENNQDNHDNDKRDYRNMGMILPFFQLLLIFQFINIYEREYINLFENNKMKK